MSTEFLQMVQDHDDLRVVHPDPSLVAKEVRRDEWLLAIPKTTTNYQKAALECLANMTGKFVVNLSKTCRVPDRANKNDVPIEMVHLLIELARLNQYMINSTSWDKGQTFEFDFKEIQNRLKRCEIIFAGEYKHREYMAKQGEK